MPACPISRAYGPLPKVFSQGLAQLAGPAPILDVRPRPNSLCGEPVRDAIVDFARHDSALHRAKGASTLGDSSFAQPLGAELPAVRFLLRELAVAVGDLLHHAAVVEGVVSRAPDPTARVG